MRHCSYMKAYLEKLTENLIWPRQRPVADSGGAEGPGPPPLGKPKNVKGPH